MELVIGSILIFFVAFQNIVQSRFNIFGSGIIQFKNIDVAVKFIQVLLCGNKNNAIDHAVSKALGAGDKLDGGIERNIV